MNSACRPKRRSERSALFIPFSNCCVISPRLTFKSANAMLFGFSFHYPGHCPIHFFELFQVFFRRQSPCLFAFVIPGQFQGFFKFTPVFLAHLQPCEDACLPLQRPKLYALLCLDAFQVAFVSVMEVPESVIPKLLIAHSQHPKRNLLYLIPGQGLAFAFRVVFFLSVAGACDFA